MRAHKSCCPKNKTGSIPEGYSLSPENKMPSKNKTGSIPEEYSLSQDRTSTLGSFLASRLEDKSLFEDFLFYKNDIDTYVACFGNQFLGLLKKDESILRFLVESYNSNLTKNTQTKNLFEKLFFAFVNTCSWKHLKTLTQGNIRDPGIYVLYNKVTSVSYIGESKSIEQRFVSHISDLQNHKHANKGLQNAATTFGLENLFFFVLDFGIDYESLEDRRNKEVDYIRNWPGLIYNKKEILKD